MPLVLFDIRQFSLFWSCYMGTALWFLTSLPCQFFSLYFHFASKLLYSHSPYRHVTAGFVVEREGFYWDSWVWRYELSWQLCFKWFNVVIKLFIFVCCSFFFLHYSYLLYYSVVVILTCYKFCLHIYRKLFSEIKFITDTNARQCCSNVKKWWYTNVVAT